MDSFVLWKIEAVMNISKIVCTEGLNWSQVYLLGCSQIVWKSVNPHTGQEYTSLE
jgi:hypothetical protein